MTTSEEILRRLSIGDPAYCHAVLSADPATTPPPLDARSVALLRLGGAIAAGSSGPMWVQRVDDALDAGLTFDEVVGALVALAPTIGIERAVAVAPDLAAALGYNVDAALEQLDEPVHPGAARVAGAGGEPG